ncbi:hypothetical protein TNCV_4009471 [Trichonephila clavipes]|nr:hypothetical protein TNCV_4009471 [Trichonephila clavipes]
MDLVILDIGQVMRMTIELAPPLQTSKLRQREEFELRQNPTQRVFNSARARTQDTQGHQTATAGSDVVQSGRPIFDDFFQHLWPYIGNNTANVVFQMVKRLWLIHIDQ